MPFKKNENAMNKKRGRPGWTPDKVFLDELESMAARGLNNDQIASSIKLERRYFYAKKANFPEMDEAINRGKAKGILRVANALFENAIVSNNVTAQIFFLKARAGWRDNFVEHSGSLEVVDVRKLSDAALLEIVNPESESGTGTKKTGKDKKAKLLPVAKNSKS
jgi:hypothetical protein